MLRRMWRGFVGIVKKGNWRAALRSLWGSLLAALFGLVLALLFSRAKWMFLATSHHYGLHKAQIYLAVLVAICGIAAFIFKQVNQMQYGFVEMIFGSISAFSIAFGISPVATVSLRSVVVVGRLRLRDCARV